MTPLSWSCSTRSFPLAPLELAVRIAEGLGFGAVDLCVAANSRHLPLQRVLSDPAGSVDQVMQVLAARSMHVADVRAHAAAMSGQAVAQLVAFAKGCSARVVTLAWSREDGLEPIQALARLAPETGLQPAIEACSGTPPEMIGHVAEEHRLGVTLDYGTFLSAGINEAQVDPLLPLVTHMRVRGVASGSLQTAWTANAVDYSRVIDMLLSRGYGGFIAADYIWDPSQGCNRNDTMAETVLMRRQLESCLTALRAL